jgi:G patch domain/KOW motif-containing protein
MKLSFSLPTKQSSRPQSNLQHFDASKTDQDDKSSVVRTEFVTEFDPSKLLADPKKLIIPPKPNEWRPHKKMKNLELPVKSEDPNLKFETESAFIADPTDSTISYGLNLRQPENIDSNGVRVKTESESEERVFQRPASVDGLMLQKLRDDLDKLPDDRGFEEFTDVPVEGFGAALLAGYGWYEGRGIGKNHIKDVKVVEYKRWNAKEGLGFVAMPPPPPSPPKVGVVQDKKRNGTKKDEVFSVGKEVRIIGGQYIGVRAKVLEVKRGGDSVILSLVRTKEEVNVKTHNITELGSLEEERCLTKLKSQDRENGKKSSNVRNKERKKENQEPSWLTPNIKVRIISKELKNGKFYLKKGTILDVVGPYKCDISMDESRELIQAVDQEFLETAIPRRDGLVTVLYGRHKGVYGNLVDKNMENEIGVVQDSDNHSLITVRLEQIAEYVGEY